MANILGTLTNSTGEEVSGQLKFTLVTSYPDDTTNPDTLRLPITHTFDIASGIININVPETETLGIPYLIEFWRTDEIVPDVSFYSVIPNVGTVQFASLIPTGISNSVLDTGALRVAKLLTTDVTLAPIIRRPTIYSARLEGITDTTRFFFPKTWSGGTYVYNFQAFIVSGYTGWDFNVGQVDSAWSDNNISVASSSTVTGAGRTIRELVFNASVPSSSRALYLEAAAGTGAGAIFGTMSLRVVETA